MVGIEPTTGSLQDCYSTTELHRLSSLRPNEFPRPAHYHPPHARRFSGWHSLALSERLAGLTGLGPATFGVTSRCSSHLRYNPIGGTVEESNSESASNRRSTLELLPTKLQAIGTEPQERFPGAPPGTCFSAIQLSNITAGLLCRVGTRTLSLSCGARSQSFRQELVGTAELESANLLRVEQAL